MDLDDIEQALKKGDVKKSYVFCGVDENIIKEAVNNIIKSVIDPGFGELNIIKMDGSKALIDDVINACETMPFMSDKKIVLLYRCSFLADRDDRENKKKFEEINKYIDTLPPHCVLIMYYIFEDEREKPGSNLKKLEKKCAFIKADKLKGDRLYRKVNSLFEARKKEIDKVLLKYFCDNIDNNMDIINNEVNKLLDYTEGRDITKKDIMDLLPNVSGDDIFDLVDFLSQKRPEKALEILNELVFRGESVTSIMYMIVRQFKLLYNIKLGIDVGKNKEVLAKELKLHPFICEKLMGQSRKFSIKQLRACMELCLNTEKSLKSSSRDKKFEMEMLIINTVRV